MPANCDASVNARPTPLWEHMTFSILLHENHEIKGFLFFRSLGDTVRAPGIALAAAAILALEAVALLVFAVVELAGLGAGDAASLPTALALIVLTLIGSAALVAFAVGTRVGKSWARSGGVVFQVLAVALALASHAAADLVAVHPRGRASRTARVRAVDLERTPGRSAARDGVTSESCGRRGGLLTSGTAAGQASMPSCLRSRAT